LYHDLPAQTDTRHHSTALVKFGAQGALGTLVALSLVRELGPVLTAIMITARAGSAMTAEIGIQRISEQIDALDTMRIDPLKFLISPRIAAAIISFPLLTALFDLIGILGGFLSGVVLLGVNAGTYFHRVQSSVEMQDVTDGFIKRTATVPKVLVFPQLRPLSYRACSFLWRTML
jgi:phospholipid/cholesterol/gamma-HCH transport system permease protein